MPKPSDYSHDAEWFEAKGPHPDQLASAKVVKPAPPRRPRGKRGGRKVKK